MAAVGGVVPRQHAAFTAMPSAPKRRRLTGKRPPPTELSTLSTPEASVARPSLLKVRPGQARAANGASLGEARTRELGWLLAEAADIGKPSSASPATSTPAPSVEPLQSQSCTANTASAVEEASREVSGPGRTAADNGSWSSPVRVTGAPSVEPKHGQSPASSGASPVQAKPQGLSASQELSGPSAAAPSNGSTTSALQVCAAFAPALAPWQSQPRATSVANLFEAKSRDFSGPSAAAANNGNKSSPPKVRATFAPSVEPKQTSSRAASAGNLAEAKSRELNRPSAPAADNGCRSSAAQVRAAPVPSLEPKQSFRRAASAGSLVEVKSRELSGPSAAAATSGGKSSPPQERATSAPSLEQKQSLSRAAIGGSLVEAKSRELSAPSASAADNCSKVSAAPVRNTFALSSELKQSQSGSGLKESSAAADVAGSRKRSLSSPIDVDGPSPLKWRQGPSSSVGGVGHVEAGSQESTTASEGTADSCSGQAVMVHRDAKPSKPLLESPVLSHANRARLISIRLEDFRIFRAQVVQLQAACMGDDSCCCHERCGSGACAVVGDNSSGKTTILEAIQFALVRGYKRDIDLKNLIRRPEEDEPSPERASVTVDFEGGATVRREIVRADGCEHVFWIGAGGNLREVSRAEYIRYLFVNLGWPQENGISGSTRSELMLPQFAFLEGRGAKQLLDLLPEEFQTLSASPTFLASSSFLKRKRGQSSHDLNTASAGVSDNARRLAIVEAQLARHVDDIYRELTREPPPEDDPNGIWGEGGKARLRRSCFGTGGLGTFSLTVATHRRAEGVPLQALSDGDKDLCAIALSLAIVKIRQQQEAAPDFVLLDEPDSRLDKRYAKALWRYLRGPKGPRQSFVTSLNNHRGFDGVHCGVRLLEGCSGST